MTNYNTDNNSSDFLGIIREMHGMKMDEFYNLVKVAVIMKSSSVTKDDLEDARTLYNDTKE